MNTPHCQLSKMFQLVSMAPCLHMDKHHLGKHIRWKASYMILNYKELSPELSMTFSIIFMEWTNQSNFISKERLYLYNIFKGTIHSSLWSSHLWFLGSTYINSKCIYEHLRCFISIREGLRSTLVKFYGPRIKGLSSRAIFENRIFSRFSTILEKALELIPWQSGLVFNFDRVT